MIERITLWSNRMIRLLSQHLCLFFILTIVSRMVTYRWGLSSVGLLFGLPLDNTPDVRVQWIQIRRANGQLEWCDCKNSRAVPLLCYMSHGEGSRALMEQTATLWHWVWPTWIAPWHWVWPTWIAPWHWVWPTWIALWY